MTAGTVTGWTYTGTHPATVIFTEALAAGAPIRFEPGMRILEIGCAEHDWLSPAATTWPECEFVGIDWNVPTNERPGVMRLTASAMWATLFPSESFDGVMALSSLEHIGLGHYGDPPDPVDPDGDSKAVANVWRWLKPGGWFYFDVPYNPEGYRVVGTSHRVYGSASIVDRLRWSGLILAPERRPWAPRMWVGYADQHGHLCERPTEAQTRNVDDFDHYTAMVWQKA